MISVVFSGVLNYMVNGVIVIRWVIVFVNVLNILVFKLIVGNNINVGEDFFDVGMLCFCVSIEN